MAKETKVLVRLDHKYKIVDKDKNVSPEIMVFNSLEKIEGGLVYLKDSSEMSFQIKQEDVLYIREVEVKDEEK